MATWPSVQIDIEPFTSKCRICLNISFLGFRCNALFWFAFMILSFKSSSFMSWRKIQNFVRNDMRHVQKDTAFTKSVGDNFMFMFFFHIVDSFVVFIL